MTMHLERGLTTLNTKKRKKQKKITTSKLAKYEEEMRKHNKYMKRIGCHGLQMNLQEYIDYCHGKYKPKTESSVVSTPWYHVDSSYRRETQSVPSLTTSASFGPATKKPRMEYTGERKLVGIAMMHKSNLVPVFADDDDKTGSKQATEIAQMRRN